MTPPLEVEALLRERLASLAPLAIEIIDDSALHAGHAGAREGGSRVTCPRSATAQAASFSARKLAAPGPAVRISDASAP